MQILRLLCYGGVIMVITAFSFNSSNKSNQEMIRHAVYAGSWYPGTKDELASAVDSYIDSVESEVHTGRVLGMVVPHAGYAYSAPVAAYAYKQLKKRECEIVVLIGNAHREGFQGAVIDGVSAYESPLGRVGVDQDLATQLTQNTSAVRIDDKPHKKEHSLEMQIPFLQRVLKSGFKLLPILMGYDSESAEEHLLSVLPQLLKDKSFVIISSTDLSHYPTYTTANQIDPKTIEIIASMDSDALKRHEIQVMSQGLPNLACALCASSATRVVMSLCQKLGADDGRVLRCANSGDIANGDRKQVVGYGAVVFSDSGKNSEDLFDDASREEILTIDEQNTLLQYSRQVLTEYVNKGNARRVEIDGRLSKMKRGVFVSLHIGHDLRGCIGYIEPVKTCLDAVRDNTISACSSDPRFLPVKPDELSRIGIEISVLTPPQQISGWKDIKIGRHGIILEKGRHRSVFLPQVAPEQGWDLETTLHYLSQKAGLSANAWREGCVFKVFEAQVFKEASR